MIGRSVLRIRQPSLPTRPCQVACHTALMVLHSDLHSRRESGLMRRARTGSPCSFPRHDLALGSPGTRAPHACTEDAVVYATANCLLQRLSDRYCIHGCSATTLPSNLPAFGSPRTRGVRGGVRHLALT